MSQFRSDLALAALAVVGVVADLACVLTGHTPPQLFDQVALAGLTGAAGVAMQARSSDSTAAQTPPPVAYQAVPPAAQVQQSSAAVDSAPYSGPVGM